jgi:hypothetical protein
LTTYALSARSSIATARATLTSAAEFRRAGTVEQESGNVSGARTI